VQKIAFLYSTFQQNIFFKKTISEKAVQAVRRYKPYKTGPSGVPVAYHRCPGRYGLNQKTRNYIAVFRKIFFVFFVLSEKYYIEERNKGWGIDTARKRVVRLR
jgi:hypothetical protein